jgi:hypothetical protein
VRAEGARARAVWCQRAERASTFARARLGRGWRRARLGVSLGAARGAARGATLPQQSDEEAARVLRAPGVSTRGAARAAPRGSAGAPS